MMRNLWCILMVNIWELVKNWEHLDTALKKRRKNPEKRNSNPQFADADNV